MTWVRIDDRALAHPKLLRAGPAGVALWLAGLCHCNAHATDGRIDVDLVPMLYPPLGPKARATAAVLVQVGLWLDGGDHYEVHDYTQYQAEATKAARDSKREADRERQRRHRQGRDTGPTSQRDSKRDNTLLSQRDSDVTSRPRAPAPAIPARPGPTRPEAAEQPAPRTNGFESATEADSRVVAQFWNAAMRRAGYTAMHGWERWRADFDTIAVNCQLSADGVPEHAHIARAAVCAWFWLAPEGAVLSGRIKRPAFTTPGVLAKFIAADLACAQAWWGGLEATEQDQLLALLAPPQTPTPPAREAAQ